MNLVSQEKATKWKNPDGHMDGLTTNGVLVMHPAGEFVSEPAPGVWREISVCGNVFALRETRSAQQRGKLVRWTGLMEKELYVFSKILTKFEVTDLNKTHQLCGFLQKLAQT